MNWFERIYRRTRLDDDLAEELREHIEERTEQIMRLENLSRSEARQSALRAFGKPTLIQTRSLEVWGWCQRSCERTLRLGPGRIGKEITYFQPIPWHQVIGVVEDARHNGVDAPAPAIASYLPASRVSAINPADVLKAD